MSLQSFTFPAPCDLLNANQRMHWAKKARLTRDWRWTAHRRAQQASLSPLARAHITVTLSFPDRRRRDVNNYQPTAKAIVDGLVDAGVLPDDSDAYLVGPDMRAGERSSEGWVVVTVTIEALSEAAA